MTRLKLKKQVSGQSPGMNSKSGFGLARLVLKVQQQALISSSLNFNFGKMIAKSPRESSVVN